MGLNTYGEVNKPIGQIRFLEESILAKDKENKILASDLEKTKFDRDIKKALVLRQTKTIMALESKNKNLLAKTGGLIIVGSNEKVKNDNKIIPENEALSLVSGASLLLSIIALGRK